MAPRHPWRAGAGELDPEALPPGEASDEELAALDDLSEPRPQIDSIAYLLALKRASNDFGRWQRIVSEIPAGDTQTLILRISTATDSLTAWELHLELDRRNVSPALRWPANATTPQMTFVSWLVDILWLAKRNPNHIAKFQSWQRLLKATPGSPAWLEAAWRIFTAMYGRQSVSSYTARGLALTPAQRQELMTLPTSRMASTRQELTGERWAETRQRLLTHAISNQDLSGLRRPHDIASRRARLWQTFVLSGKSPTATAQAWKLLTGESISRQVLTRHIDAISTALKLES